MAMSDPTGDMLARIRNALAVGHTEVDCRASRFNEAILQVMRDEGYIRGWQQAEDQRSIRIALKYYGGKPAIELLRRISRPGLRQYTAAARIKPVLGGLGIAIVSTSQGVMSDAAAKRAKIGGEVICHVA